MAFAMAAEIERDLISQRQKEALQAKKAAGVHTRTATRARQDKLDPYQPEIKSLLANGATAAVYRQALRHDRGQPAPLAEKAGTQVEKG